MRERLIGLLERFDYYAPCERCTKSIKMCEKCKNDRYADYLLANGVIVPPCKMGDTVYVIEPCTCYNKYSEYDSCHHRRTKATKWLEMVRVPTKHYTKCLKLFERPFKIEYFNKLGKTVFLTKEEAEAALKGGVQE